MLPNDLKHRATPPPLIYSEDGPIAVLRADAQSPREAFRIVAETDEWMRGEIRWAYIEALDLYRPRLSEYRESLKLITIEYWRPCETEEEALGSLWAGESWWPCESDHPGAVVYWALGGAFGT